MRPSTSWISSIRASPRPCADPPSICPMTLCGLIANPTSCAVASWTTRTRPRSWSTSTTALWAPKRNPTWTSPWPRSSSGEVRRGRHTRVQAIGSIRNSSTGATRSPSAMMNPFSTPSSVAPTRPSRRTRSNNSSSTASHAAFTAPPEISVCRDADVEPAEPISVSVACRITRSTLRTVRTICPRIVWTPWPTSAAALYTSATGPSGPDERVTRASDESSNPPLYAWFLYPTAKPTPRLIPSPRPTLPATPPGRSTASRGPDGGPGDHLAAGRGALDHLARREHRPRRSRVASAQVDRVHPERGREPVHLPLVRETHLYRAEPSHRAARWVVREHARALDQGVRHLVGARGHRAGVRDDRDRRRGVRAAVDDHPRSDVHQLALPRRARPHPDPRGVPVHMPDEGLRTAVGHLHRLAGVQREHRRVDLHAHILARPERAPRPRQEQPDLLERQVQARRHLLAVGMEPLRGDEQVDPAVVGRYRQARLGTERGLILHPGLVVALDPDVGLGVGVAVEDPKLAQDVTERMHLRRTRVERLDHVGHGRKGLVVDDDPLGRAARELGVF